MLLVEGNIIKLSSYLYLSSRQRAITAGDEWMNGGNVFSFYYNTLRTLKYCKAWLSWIIIQAFYLWLLWDLSINSLLELVCRTTARGGDALIVRSIHSRF